MPLESKIERGKHVEGRSTNGTAKRNSLQHHFVQEVSPSLVRLDSKYQDSISFTKAGRHRGRLVCNPHDVKRAVGTAAPSMGSKPWPGRMGSNVGELIKHMSNVPAYLQVGDDGLQGKALNVGVLEWGLLEKWTKQQKLETYGRSNGDSPSTTNDSSLFHTFPSSSRSSTSSRSSDRQKKQSSSICMTNGNLACLPETSTGNAVAPLKPSATRSGCISNSTMELPLDFIPFTSGNNVQKVLDHVKSDHHKAEGEELNQDVVNSVGCWQNDSGYTSWNCKSRDHYIYSPHAIPTGFDSPPFEDRGGNLKNFSGNSCKHMHLSRQFSHVSHSCPLPRALPGEESDVDSSSQDISSFVTTEVRGEHVASRAGTSSENLTQSRMKVDDKKVTAKLIPVIRSLSSKGRSLASQSNSTIHTHTDARRSTSNDKGRHSPLSRILDAARSRYSVTPQSSSSFEMDREKGSSNSNRRRSPLRRMLDPVLKPRNLFPDLIVSKEAQCSPEAGNVKKTLSLDESKPKRAPHKPVGNCADNTNDAHKLYRSLENHQEEGAMKMRQALVQLAWKNGLPLFMFSSGDSDILAATLQRHNIHDKNNITSIFTIYAVRQCKKKGRNWIKPTNKSPGDHLASNHVGEMSVSCYKSRCSNLSSYVSRQYVLFGRQPQFAADGSVNFTMNAELGAIIVDIPTENCTTSNLLQSNQGTKTTVILPSGIHGTSLDGKPTSLIERWKAGGVCDCGGWDEGCKFTVLGNSPLSNKNSNKPCGTKDKTQRVELFAQNCSQDGIALSMVCFKDGLYTVEFRPSITLLQVFMICIATVQNQSPARFETEASKAGAYGNYHGKRTAPAGGPGRDPASYTPYHPPLSPVGRA